MIIVVQVINVKNKYSCGRYAIPREEYDAFVKYLTKKITAEIAFKTIGRATQPDVFRPWRYI